MMQPPRRRESTPIEATSLRRLPRARRT